MKKVNELEVLRPELRRAAIAVIEHSRDLIKPKIQKTSRFDFWGIDARSRRLKNIDKLELAVNKWSKTIYAEDGRMLDMLKPILNAVEEIIEIIEVREDPTAPLSDVDVYSIREVLMEVM